MPGKKSVFHTFQNAGSILKKKKIFKIDICVFVGYLKDGHNKPFLILHASRRAFFFNL